MSGTRPKAVISWSSGKDSAFALHTVRQAGKLEVVAALTTITEEYARVSMHGVRDELLDLQAQQLGLPCTRVRIPTPCANDVYEQKMGAAVKEFRAAGITRVIFGDLYLHDIREYREKQLRGTGLEPVFPLWGLDTAELAQAMIRAGQRAIITCIDPARLDRSFAGRSYDEQLLADLPTEVDPCGENGEFHTVVVAAPVFRAEIAVRVGEVVERDGFVFADIIPTIVDK